MFGSTLLGTVAAFLLAFEGHHFVHVPHRPARHHRHVLGAARRSAPCSIDRDRSPRAPRRARWPRCPRGTWRGWAGARGWAGGRGAGSPGLSPGPVRRHQVVGAVLPRRLRPDDGAGGTSAPGGRPGCAAGAARRVAQGRARAPRWRWSAPPWSTYLVSWVGLVPLHRSATTGSGRLHTRARGCGWVPAALRSCGSTTRRSTSSTSPCTSATRTRPTRGRGWSRAGRRRSSTRGPSRAQDGCTVEQCSKAITSIGTVSIWWLGTIAVFVAAVLLAAAPRLAGRRHPGRASPAATCPWFNYQHRTIYSFYAVAFEPWVVLAVVFVLGLVLGGRSASTAATADRPWPSSAATSCSRSRCSRSSGRSTPPRSSRRATGPTGCGSPAGSDGSSAGSHGPSGGSGEPVGWASLTPRGGSTGGPRRRMLERSQPTRPTSSRAGPPFHTKEIPMGSIRVAIVGVGNCASSLVQGVEYYKDADPTAPCPGLMHVKFGDYHVSDVEFVAAFDVDAKKVGLDLVRGHRRQREQHHQDRRRAHHRRDRPARPHPRRPRQVLPRDHRGVRRRAGRRRRSPQGRPGRRPRLLPAGRLRGRRQVLRPVRHRRRRRLRQRPAGLHRLRPRRGPTKFEAAGVPDHRRRHQVPGRRHHHAPRHGQAVRGPRRRAGPHLPAQRRRQHGLQEHARARPPRVQEDLQDPGRDLQPRPRPRRPQRPHRPVGLRRSGSTTASGPTSASRAAPSATSR